MRADNAVKTHKADGPAGADIHRLVEFRQPGRAERGDGDAREFPVRAAQRARQLNQPGAAETAAHRLADHKSRLGRIPMHGENFPVAQVGRVDGCAQAARDQHAAGVDQAEVRDEVVGTVDFIGRAVKLRRQRSIDGGTLQRPQDAVIGLDHADQLVFEQAGEIVVALERVGLQPIMVLSQMVLGRAPDQHDHGDPEKGGHLRQRPQPSAPIDFAVVHCARPMRSAHDRHARLLNS
jgi:hypothetical protein